MFVKRTTDRTRRSWLRLADPRIKALLAGGGVMVLGTGVALAAWTDDAFVNGTFGTGTFNLQASVDGSTWADYAVSPGGTMTVSSGAAALTPGDKAYSLVQVRLEPTSTYSANVALSGSSVSGPATLTSQLTYSARSYTGTSSVPACSAAGFASFPTALVTASALGAGASSNVAITNTDVVNVCFEVTLSGSATATAQGQSATPVWRFGATST